VVHDEDRPRARNPDVVPDDDRASRAGEGAQLTAVYVGGPQDGQTEEILATPGPGDPPNIVRVVGFEVWPMAHPLRPTGRYEPDTSGGGHTVPFIWQAYTPEVQTRRQQEAERSGRVTQASTLRRAVFRVFWGTPIIGWIVRLDQRRRRAKQARADGHGADPGDG
jgi:hypothetical protein